MSPLNYLAAGDFTNFILRVLYILPALVIAISFHEAAHAWAAYKMGDPTAKNLGRLTLDPTKHFTLWGVIVFVLIGFGWGKPVPTNPRNYHDYKKGNAYVALAGVTTNIIIALVTLIIISVLTISGTFYSVIPVNLFFDNVQMSVLLIIHTILYYIASINILLFFFNLIPIPPLDGHHLVKEFIARKSQNFYMSYQRYGFMILILLLFATPLRTWLSQLVLLIVRGVAGIFGAPVFPI